MVDKIELVGMLATSFVLLSLIQRDILKLRILNSIGCVLFVFYGAEIGSPSVYILNAACLCTNIWRLIQSHMAEVTIPGKIVIGYQGIGKSTLAKKNHRFVDLDSSMARWYIKDQRPGDWYIEYCNTAIQLAVKGKIVFVSSHREVRDYLAAVPIPESVQIVTCSPDVTLKHDWISRLKNRYDETNLEKDYRAYMNALENYDFNVQDIQNSPFTNIRITSMDYDLEELLK